MFDITGGMFSPLRDTERLRCFFNSFINGYEKENHLSDFWYKNDPEDYCNKMNGTDADLAAHFVIIKKVGIVLCGSYIDEVFGDVPKEYYIESIKSDIEDAKTSIMDNPMYIILNLTRVFAYIRYELVLSKEQGAKWALNNLDIKYHDIVKRALVCYQSRKQMSVERGEAEEYCDYMLNQIFDKI